MILQPPGRLPSRWDLVIRGVKARSLLFVAVLFTVSPLNPETWAQQTAPSPLEAASAIQLGSPGPLPSPSPSLRFSEHPTAKKSFAEVLELWLKIVAYVVGAGWVYFNFVRGRTYHPRLELRGSGDLVSDARGNTYVRAALQVKNVGSSKVTFDRVGSGVRLYFYDPEVESTWRQQDYISPVLLHHGWIEPGETVEDQIFLFAGAGPIVAAKLEFDVACRRMFHEPSVWVSSAIVLPQTKGDAP